MNSSHTILTSRPCLGFYEFVTMPTLDIPASGLSFESVSERTSKSTSQDIIGLTLTDDLIEEMIQCVQNGKQIHLSLGSRPVRPLIFKLLGFRGESEMSCMLL